MQNLISTDRDETDVVGCRRRRPQIHGEIDSSVAAFACTTTPSWQRVYKRKNFVYKSRIHGVQNCDRRICVPSFHSVNGSAVKLLHRYVIANDEQVSPFAWKVVRMCHLMALILPTGSGRRGGPRRYQFHLFFHASGASHQYIVLS